MDTARGARPVSTVERFAPQNEVEFSCTKF